MISHSPRYSSRSISDGSKASVEEEEEGLWTPYVVVEKGHRRKKLPSFAELAKYLQKDEGLAFRQHWKVTYIASAQEMLAWYKLDNPEHDESWLKVSSRLITGSRVRVEPHFRSGSPP